MTLLESKKFVQLIYLFPSCLSYAYLSLVHSKGSMGQRAGLILVFLLAASLACDARELAATVTNKLPEVSVLPLKDEKRFGASEQFGRNENVCSLCEEYASEALKYFEQNKTQTEVIAILHQSCSKLRSLKQQCMTLVDYYAPLFFLEISTIEPQAFCEKVDLCNEVVSYAQKFSQNSCDVCHMAVSEAVSMLKNPDNQLEILELLLKECKTVEKYIPKCKKMVFEYAPLILANAEQFLEKEVICTQLHACDSASSMEKASLLLDH